jgi:nitrous oxide reductase accessory protein NosL
MIRSLFLAMLFLTTLFAHADYSQAVKIKKIYPLGKKIYEKKCRELDLDGLSTQEELLERIDSSKCSKLSSKYKEALTLYLWEQKLYNHTPHYKALKVTKEQKCPVCGMFLYKYPNWVSMIEYNNGKKYYFDGMKDLMKYYFENPNEVKQILTQAYYTQKTINAKDAYFVTGSDVYGPMGNEFIPLANKEAAKKFLIEHRGKKIIRFDTITPEVVEALD